MISGVMGKRTIGSIGIMSGIPNTHTEFTLSLAQMLQYTHEYVCNVGEIVHLVRTDLSYHAAARNELVLQMLGDWLLMLDCDHAFAPDLLARMVYTMNTYELDALTAIYHSRLPPYRPVLYHWNKEDSGCIQVLDWDKKAKIFQVDSCGGGCLLVKRQVFERIYTELKEEPFAIIPPFSEDHSFFRRLKKLGIKSYCAPAIQSAHLATRPITSDQYVDRAEPLGSPIVVDGR